MTQDNTMTTMWRRIGNLGRQLEQRENSGGWDPFSFGGAECGAREELGGAGERKRTRRLERARADWIGNGTERDGYFLRSRASWVGVAKGKSKTRSGIVLGLPREKTRKGQDADALDRLLADSFLDQHLHDLLALVTLQLDDCLWGRRAGERAGVSTFCRRSGPETFITRGKRRG